MDATEVLEKAREVAEKIRPRAAETENLRRIPKATIDDIHQAGLFRVLQPARYGGYEHSPQVFYDVVMELASACGSTGWVYSVLTVHAWQMALFPAEAQDDVWGDDSSTLISSSYAPGGVEAVDGGFRLSGTWKFSSGCQVAQWAFLGGLVPGADGIPVFHTFLVPRSDYEILDTWHVVGLCGTGSNDIRLGNVFVPEHRAHRMLEQVGGPGSAINTAVIYKLPFASVFSYSITAPAIGMAIGALDAHKDLMRERVRQSYGGERAADDPFSQVRIAEAAADIDAARAQLYYNFEEIMSLANAGKEIPMALRVRLRRDQVRGTALAIRATSRIFENSGANALYGENPIQRAWRDVHAARVHAINDPERAAKVYGAMELGVDLTAGGMF